MNISQKSYQVKEIDKYFAPQKQTLGFPKVEYKPLLKGKLTKVNKPTTLE